MYLRHEFVITNALINTVVMIASYRPLASVSESALHNCIRAIIADTLKAVNNREEEALKDINSINPLNPLSPAHVLKFLRC